MRGKIQTLNMEDEKFHHMVPVYFSQSLHFHFLLTSCLHNRAAAEQVIPSPFSPSGLLGPFLWPVLFSACTHFDFLPYLENTYSSTKPERI